MDLYTQEKESKYPKLHASVHFAFITIRSHKQRLIVLKRTYRPVGSSASCKWKRRTERFLAMVTGLHPRKDVPGSSYCLCSDAVHEVMGASRAHQPLKKSGAIS
jgi:hypothetical protein